MGSRRWSHAGGGAGVGNISHRPHTALQHTKSSFLFDVDDEFLLSPLSRRLLAPSAGQQHNGSLFADLSLLETATAMSDDDACWFPRRHHQTPPSHERTIIATSPAYTPAVSTSTAAVTMGRNLLLDCSADSCYQEGSGKQKAPLRHEVEEQQWRWGDSPPSSLQYHPHTANARTAPPHTPTDVDPMSYLLNTTMTSHADMCGWGMVGSSGGGVPRRGGLLVSSLWGVVALMLVVWL